MLCVSLADKNKDSLKAQLQEAPMAEIRIESCELDVAAIAEIFSLHMHLVATCRPDPLTDAERMVLLKAAIDHGAEWVDVEVESNQAFTQELVRYAKSKECKVIISYHNYEETPEMPELKDIVAECKKRGADLIKLATQVNAKKDNARLLALYQQDDVPVLALGMGSMGTITRIAATKLGAPFTFVRGDELAETAPGQLSLSMVQEILKHL